jgi:hypothetical protein
MVDDADTKPVPVHCAVIERGVNKASCSGCNNQVFVHLMSTFSSSKLRSR